MNRKKTRNPRESSPLLSGPSLLEYGYNPAPPPGNGVRPMAMYGPGFRQPFPPRPPEQRSSTPQQRYPVPSRHRPVIPQHPFSSRGPRQFRPRPPAPRPPKPPFPKPLDLPSAIPDMKTASKEGSDQKAQNVKINNQRLKSFKANVAKMLKSLPNNSVPLNEFVQTYHQKNGCQVKLSDYSCKSLTELLGKIRDTVLIKSSQTGGPPVVVILKKRQDGNKKVRASDVSERKLRPTISTEKETTSETLFTFLSDVKSTTDIVTLENETDEEEDIVATKVETRRDNFSSTVSSVANSVDLDFDEEDPSDDDDELLQGDLSQIQEEFDSALTLSESPAVSDSKDTNSQGVAIFWDIENCPVPKKVSTSEFVSKIRDRFCKGGCKQLEFIAIHNGKNDKLNQELHELGLDVSLSVVGRKNSADEIIKDKMSRVVEKHRDRPCSLLLISGDVDFSRDLAKFRFSYQFRTILVHNKQAKQTLKSVVEEKIPIESLFTEPGVAKVGKETLEEKKNAAKKEKKAPVPAPVQVQNSKGPKCFFSIHGEVDLDIPKSQALQFFHEMKARLVTEFFVDVVLEEESFRHMRENGSVQLSANMTINCGKKKGQKCKKFINESSEENFRIQCIEVQDKAQKIDRDALKNEASKKKALKELQLKVKNLTKKHNAKVEAIKEEIIKEQFRSQVCRTVKTRAKANKFLEDAAVSVTSNSMVINLEKEVEDLESQLKVFSATCQEYLRNINALNIELKKTEFDGRLSEVRFKLGKELVTFENPLPIYKFRREIQETVERHSVTILMAETGSGKSTQVVQYLHEKSPDQMIVCTQPRKIAAVSLAGHVARQMGCQVGDLVGYKVGSQVKMSRNTRIVFMTDQLLVNECVKDPNFSKYHCVILDEVHERSINTDLLLGLSKNGLKNNPDLKVVITSATMDPKLFFAHFEDQGSNVSVETMDIPGRTFPIEIKWTEQDIDTSRDYLSAALRKVEEILETTQRGDILVFLATPADTDHLSSKLRDRNSVVESLQLHGKLQIEEQKKIFEPGAKRRVIFTTNCAETSVTVPGIKYVVDPGIAKEKKFDPKRNSSSLVVQKINQSSARQRAGRAGRTEPGVCYRLYSEPEFRSMNIAMVAEIRRVQLGQTVLKLIDLGIPRPDQFPFIESPGVENFRNSISELQSLEALTVDEKSGDPKLTQVGFEMSKLPLEPRLAKLVLVSNREGDGENALILASLCSMAGNVFFRLGSNEDCSQADQKKINFCDETGDFLTLVNVFNEWSKVAERKKSQWCVVNFINGKSMKMARDMLVDLKSVFKNDLQTAITSPILLLDEEERLKKLQLNIFQCFRTNLCVYGGHPRVGYINVRTRDVYPIHPSSSFSYLGNLTPQLIIYDQILSTSRTFLLNLSSVEAGWLSPQEKTLLLEAQDLVVSPFKVGPVGPRILRQSIIGYKWSELKKLEQELKSCIGEEHFLEINCSVEDGSICFATNGKFHAFVENNITEKIKFHQQVLENECQDVSLIEDKSRPKAIIGAGAVLEDIILENEFSDFMIKFDNNADEDTFYEICDFARTQIGLVKVNHLRKTGNRVVMIRNFSLATEALRKVKEFAELNNFDPQNIYPLTSARRGSSQTGLEVKLSFPRRKLRKFGFIKFESEEDAFLVLSKMDSSLMTFSTESLRLKLDQKGDKKSLFFALNKHLVSPPNLVKQIKQRLKQNGMPFKEVYIPMEPGFVSTDAEMKSLRQSIAALLKFSLLAVEKDFDIDIRLPYPKAGMWVVKVIFQSSVIGINVGNFLKNNPGQTVRWSQPQEEGADTPRSEYFTVDFDLTTSFSCSRKIFDVLKEPIEKTVKEVSELFKDAGSLSLNIKSFTAGDSNRAVFFIKGTNIAVLARTKDALDSILAGEKIDHPNIKLLLNPGTIKHLQSIEDSSDVFIEKFVKRGFIIIYGSDRSINMAKSKINTHLSTLVTAGHSVFHENMRNHPNGLVKEMVKTFGPDFRSLLDIEGVHSVKYLVNMRRLEVIASKPGHSQVQTEVAALASGISVVGEEEEETCPVCFSAPEAEEGVRLNHCGHLHCKDCLQLAMGSSAWPLTCSTQDCGHLLVVEDFKLLTADLQQKLMKNALDHKLTDVESDLAACPSPNCTGVYRKVRSGQEGQTSFCNFCGVNICRSCDCVYHTGMTCQFYQIYKTDNDHSLRAWLQEDLSNRKLCPQCQSPIEKNGGCLHIHCIKCNSHLCWNCMKVYPSGQSVYTHTCRS